jgi:hypothetical protein
MKKIIRVTFNFFYKTLLNNLILHKIENLLIKSSNVDKKNNKPIIFIIGAGRTGSTLLYQSLIQLYDFGYFSNLHCAFYGSAGLVEKIFHPTKYKKKSNFKSKYGRTNSITSPCECGNYWYQFFRKNPPYVDLDDISTKKLDELSNSLNYFSSSFKNPVIIKNLYNSLRLLPIAKALPNSIFIIMKRDEIDTAQSIMVGRKAFFGDYDQWFSLKPPNYDDLLKLPNHMQVVEQIRSIYNQINKNKSIIGKHRFIEIKYEDFCDHTEIELKRLEKFFLDQKLQFSRVDKIPGKFKRKKKIRINKNLYKKIKEYSNK